MTTKPKPGTAPGDDPRQDDGSAPPVPDIPQDDLEPLTLEPASVPEAGDPEGEDS